MFDDPTVQDFTSAYLREIRSRRTDPASKAPGLPPNYGREVLPHTVTFQSMIGQYSRAYQNPDLALRESPYNAVLMKNDIGVMECVEARKRLCANLDWEILPEDERCPYQMSLADKLTKILKRVKRLQSYLYTLMDAIWVGRSAIQNRFGWENVDGQQVMMPKPLCHDHCGWMHIHGDKLVFRYEQQDGFMPPGAYPHQMGIRVQNWHWLEKNDLLRKQFKAEPYGNGMAVFLEPFERDQFTVHKHIIEDSEFEYVDLAGSIHGVGIRSRIYWEWFLLSEARAFMFQYLERSAGGIEIWTYPSGDPKALEAVQKAANERQANGRNTIFFPKPLGEDGPLYDVNIVEPGATGLQMIQELIERYYCGRIKRYILGQQLSSEAAGTGLGSGVADAHMETLAQIVRHDARNLEQTVTDELVRVIQKLNWPETLGWHMRFVLKTEDDKAKSKLEQMVMAHQMGLPIAEREVYKALSVSAPKPDDKVLSGGAGGGAGMGGDGLFNGPQGPVKGMPEEISSPDSRNDFPDEDKFRQKRTDDTREQ